MNLIATQGGVQMYYVYEWYNVDTGEILYVGKGKGYRYKVTHGRNKL